MIKKIKRKGKQFYSYFDFDPIQLSDTKTNFSFCLYLCQILHKYAQICPTVLFANNFFFQFINYLNNYTLEGHYLTIVIIIIFLNDKNFQ